MDSRQLRYFIAFTSNAICRVPPIRPCGAIGTQPSHINLEAEFATPLFERKPRAWSRPPQATAVRTRPHHPGRDGVGGTGDSSRAGQRHAGDI